MNDEVIEAVHYSMFPKFQYYHLYFDEEFYHPIVEMDFGYFTVCAVSSLINEYYRRHIDMMKIIKHGASLYIPKLEQMDNDPSFSLSDIKYYEPNFVLTNVRGIADSINVDIKQDKYNNTKYLILTKYYTIFPFRDNEKRLLEEYEYAGFREEFEDKTGYSLPSDVLVFLNNMYENWVKSLK